MTRLSRSPYLLALAAFASVADAQTLGTATYHMQFGNGTNQIVLGPGESTTVTVLVSFNPGIGVVIGSAPPLQGPVLGLNDGAFSITGTPSGGATGNFGLLPGPNHPSLVWPFNFLAGLATLPGTPAGNSLNGVVWGMSLWWVPPGGHPAPWNPAAVWTGTFTVAPASGAGLINLAFTALGPTGIVVSGPTPGSLPWVATYGTDPGPGATIIVPAPAAALALALAGIAAARRARKEVLR